jgi:hypothetical protein
VSCACYSEYLSSRDHASLEFLFKALDIQEYISYCTLVKLCETEINQNVNIRECVAAAIVGHEEVTSHSTIKSKAGAVAVKNCPRVLLVDEVDVFFTKDFYGNTYNPACDLRHASISELIQKIWEQGSSIQLNLDIVKRWPVYSDVCAAFSSWVFLIDAAITQMIVDLAEFPSHEYVVMDGKVGYREQDGVAFNVSDRYLTTFAYIKEKRAGRVSEPDMLKNLKLLVQCGHFLFAKLPCKFNLVLGVTGTLETLSDAEKTIIRDQYAIAKFVIMPSVYGINAVTMDSITTIPSASDFFKSIVNEIDKYVKQGRAVIVFFKDEETLINFWKSDCFKAHVDGGQVHLLLEEIRPDEKHQIISCRSGAAGAVTLATRPFGRGTDFAALGDAVNKSGGIHVIATFVAESESEEIQIKGRTARQGEKGSFSLVLPAIELAQLGVQGELLDTVQIRTAEADQARTWWGKLNDARRCLCEAKYAKLEEYVAEKEAEHSAAMAFTVNLLDRNLDEVKRFLGEQNPLVVLPSTSKTRILVLMDATGSMGSSMHATKETVGVMFDRATEILEDEFKGRGGGLFEMQFAVYRNYKSGADMLLEASEWRSNPQDLKDFLGRVKACGGQKNEAVEIGLWHANQQVDLKQASCWSP